MRSCRGASEPVTEKVAGAAPSSGPPCFAASLRPNAPPRPNRALKLRVVDLWPPQCRRHIRSAGASIPSLSRTRRRVPSESGLVFESCQCVVCLASSVKLLQDALKA